MSAAKKRTPFHTRKRTTAGQLAKELATVKAEVKQLRAKCDRTSRTLLRLCCPEEWFDDDIDDDEVWSQMTEIPSFDAWIERLAKRQ
jgi:hypothetical protein